MLDTWNYAPTLEELCDELWERQLCEEDDDDPYWEDDGPTSCRDIISECDMAYYYSD